MIKFFIKLLRPLITRLQKLWWHITQPKTSGAHVLIFCKNEVLLVKTTYGYTFGLPGGGIKRGEFPYATAKREVLEEVGITLDTLVPLPSFVVHEDYKEDTVYGFYAEVTSKEVSLDWLEIDIVEWYTLENLPPVTRATSIIIELCKKQKFTYLN